MELISSERDRESLQSNPIQNFTSSANENNGSAKEFDIILFTWKYLWRKEKSETKITTKTSERISIYS